MVNQQGKEIFHKGNEIGVLIIHGFTVSPSYLCDVAEIYIQKNYTVLAPCLKGHGGEASELKNVKKDDWKIQIKHEYKRLIDLGCKKIVVIGHSLGGCLSLYLAEEFEPACVVAMSPPYYIFAGGAIKVVSKLHWLIRSHPMGLDDPGQGKAFRYYNIPTKILKPMLYTFKTVNKKLDKVDCPLMLVCATADKAVKEASTKAVLDSVRSTEKEVVVINAPHQYTYNKYFDQYIDQVKNFIAKHI